MKIIVFIIDCLMNFLKLKRSDLLESEFKRIIISNKVYNTLSNPSIPKYIREDLDSLIKKGFIKIEEISINTSVYDLYYEITKDLDKKILGEGEASSIALAVKHNKDLAFNNPELIESYLEEYGIKCITTRDILNSLVEKKTISKKESIEIINKLSQ